MAFVKKRWFKVTLIIIISSCFDFILHGLISPLSSSNVSLLKPSVLVKNGFLIPAIITWEILAFTVFAAVFIFIENKLPWEKSINGLLYGFSFAMLYQIGMFESVLLINSSIINEFLMGLGDFFPFLISGFLLGKFVGTEHIQNRRRNSIVAIFVVAFFYITGRYFAYAIVHIQSAYSTRPLGTFIWTFCQGICVGTIYFILQTVAKGHSFLSQSIFFGIFIFGANWLANHLFIACIAEFSPDLFIRVGIDIIFVVIGVYVHKKMSSSVLSNNKKV